MKSIERIMIEKRPNISDDCHLFIHTNTKQLIGAKVAEYSFRKYSKFNDRFQISILNVDDLPEYIEQINTEMMFEGSFRKMGSDDLQSFTLARFLPPSLMGYKGKAIVVDPDVFSCGGDIFELFSIQNQAPIMCKKHNEHDWASSVMLLQCGDLTDWCLEDF